jgi:hypothetical protein
MYSEYVFDEKKSEIALNKIKAIIFDIVNAEECKLSDIMKKVAEAEDSDIKNKLIDLCNQHKNNIFGLFEVFNVLNDLMQKIDNFSKDIRELENESVAEIVSNYIDQQNNEKAKQNISEEDKSVGQKKEETDSQNMDNQAEENVNQVIVDNNVEQADLNEQSQDQSELNTDQQNLDNKVEENVNQVSSEKNDNEEIKPSVESEEAVHEIVPNDPVATNDGQIFSQDMMEKDNDSVVQEKIVDIFSQNKDNETTQNNTESVPMIIDDNLNKDNEDIQDANLISEKNDSSDGEIASDNLLENQDVSNVEKPVIDVISVENVSGDSNHNNENSVINDSTDVVSNAEATLNSESEEKIDTKEENVVSDVQSDTSSNVGEIGTSIPVISESNGDDIDNNYVFEKKDSNEPKAILTTANQVSKLRNSRSNNESILTAKQFFKLEKKEDNKDLETSNMIFPDVVGDEVNNDEVVSSENNQEMSKEKQMEMMMKQITDFYKEGKVDEAQALSDKVSELNREIQQKQKTLAA